MAPRTRTEPPTCPFGGGVPWRHYETDYRRAGGDASIAADNLPWAGARGCYPRRQRDAWRRALALRRVLRANGGRDRRHQLSWPGSQPGRRASEAGEQGGDGDGCATKLANNRRSATPWLRA